MPMCWKQPMEFETIDEVLDFLRTSRRQVIVVAPIGWRGVRQLPRENGDITTYVYSIKGTYYAFLCITEKQS